MFGGRHDKILHKLELKLKKASHDVGKGVCLHSYHSIEFRCKKCNYTFSFRDDRKSPNMNVLNQPIYFHMHQYTGSVIELLTCKEALNKDERIIPQRITTRQKINIKLKKFYRKLRRFGHNISGNICLDCNASFGVEPAQTRMPGSLYIVNRILRCSEVKTVEMIRDVIE